MENSSISTTRQRQVVVKKGVVSRARELVLLIYFEQKVGRNDPKASFFRLSCQVDELCPRESIAQHQAIQSTNIWNSVNRIARLYTEDIIFAQSAEFSWTAKICIFIMDPETIQAGLNALKLRCPEWYLRVSKGHHEFWNKRQVDTMFPPFSEARMRDLVANLQFRH